MEMNLYKSHIPDGSPMVSSSKTKSYKPISNYLVLNVHIPMYLGSRENPFFEI